MGHTPTKTMTVDHKNRDKFDNRKENLRIVDKQIQSINRTQPENRKNETVGVSFKKRWNSWEACWKDENRTKYTKAFSASKYGYDEAKNMAIKYRKRKEQTLEHYIEALG